MTQFIIRRLILFIPALLGILLITFVLALVQEMSARMRAVTQKGLGELIREHYGVGWTLFALKDGVVKFDKPRRRVAVVEQATA